MTVSGLRCAVLGAGGFIGTNLCLALQREGAIVLGVGRPPQDHAESLAAISWHAAEFNDSRGIAQAVANQDVVFHLLGGSLPVESNENPIGDVLTSLIPSLALIEMCRNAAVGRLVFASSGGTVYGPSSAVPVNENAPTDPITAYGINKLAIEKYLRLFNHLHGFDAITLRISNPYGPFQHRRRPQGLVGAVLGRALTGEQIEIWGNGSIIRDYIHIDDVVAAMVAAATYSGPIRLFNVGSGEARSVRGVVESICELTSVPSSRVTYYPSRPADLPFSVLDCELLQVETSWRPRVDWKQGLASTAAWMREH